MEKEKFTKEEMRILEQIGIILKQVRVSKSLTQENLGKEVGFRKSKISNLEYAINSDQITMDYKLIELYKICKALKINLAEVIEFAIKQDLDSENTLHNIIRSLIETNNYDAINLEYHATLQHQLRLQKYSNIELIGYYTTTEMENDKLFKLSMNTEELCESGYVPLKMMVGDHKYEGKIVSPPDSKYTFFYLNEVSSDRAERAILSILHYYGKKKYTGGIGCLLSLSRGPQVLCMQKVVLFNANYLPKEFKNIDQKELKAKLMPYLKFQNNIIDNKLYLNCLDKLDKKFYDEFCKKKKMNN